MKRALRQIALLSLATALAACTLTKKVDMEINQRPTLLVEFPADARIHLLCALVYDAGGMFVDSLVMRPGVDSKAERCDTLLAGVTQGEYRVVCYGNLDLAKLSDLKKGGSTLGELYAALDPNPTADSDWGGYACADRWYYSTATLLVRRGEPANMQVVMVPRYYQVELTLQSDEDNPAPVAEYSARLVNVPGGLDAKGGANKGVGECSFVPELVTNEADYRRTAEFAMNRFEDGHGVQLVLYKGAVEIARVPVVPSLCGVDPGATKEVVLPIFVEIAIDKLMIQILDWNTVIVQDKQVGD